MSALEDPTATIEYPEPDQLALFNRVIAKEVIAYSDESAAPQSLTLGGTSNVNVEAVNDINLYVKGEGDVNVYTTTYDGGIRTDTKILSVLGSNQATVVRVPAQRTLELQAGDAANTVTFGGCHRAQLQQLFAVQHRAVGWVSL